MSASWMSWFDIRHPLICAPMGGAAGGELAGAVSATGALGMIGMGSTGSADALTRELAYLPAGSTFGIGMVDWVMRRNPELLDTAIDAAPALLSVSFGEDFDWVPRAQAAGIRTVTQVHDRDSALRAAAGGIDLLVARGLEGGGHGKPIIELASLLGQVIGATDRPVLAAGAIATGEDVQRVLSAGADGIWVGTAFTACEESLLSNEDKAELIRGIDTVLTTEFDHEAGYAWPSDIPERVLANQSRAINAGFGVRHLAMQRPARAVVEALLAESTATPI